MRGWGQWMDRAGGSLGVPPGEIIRFPGYERSDGVLRNAKDGRRRTGDLARLFSSGDIAAADFDRPIVQAGDANNLFSVLHLDAALVDDVGCPREVVGIFSTGGSEARAVDEREQPVLGVEVGEEGYG